MARATGPIGYLEHRTPYKDESGKYTIHPMFVKRDTFDMKQMTEAIKHHCLMQGSAFVQAMETIEDETLLALKEGNEVRLGDMLIIRPKLRVLVHKDADGKEWRKTYHEGDLIPANEVEICGLDIQPTKEFLQRFMRNNRGCSRSVWNVKMPPKDADSEFADIVSICTKQGYITVKDMMRHFGVTRYHASKVLEGLCEEPAARMTWTKEGPVKLYRLREEASE